MTFDRSARTTFDGVAETYDRARPGYSEQLFEDVIALSGMPQEGRILEVGCGSGQATLPFARRGYAMLCVELGADLAALARENCRPYPQVEILHTSFEDWPLERDAFDLLISAQAWHWIPPQIGYAKAAAALKDTGSLLAPIRPFSARSRRYTGRQRPT
jgi:SAM-dependent methyltransferase